MGRSSLQTASRILGGSLVRFTVTQSGKPLGLPKRLVMP